MTRNASTDDFVARDDNGDSLTVTEEMELNGEMVTVKVVPATRGLMNELEEMGAEELESEGFKRVLEKYRTPDFRNEEGEVEDETIDNIPMPRLNKLFNTFLIASGVEEEAIENPEEYVESVEGNRKSSA